MSKGLFIKTYGCQMNFYDSIKMQELLEPFNYKIVEDMSLGDAVIINTCHIREKAAEKMYSELGRVKKIKDQRWRNGASTIIIIAGCVGQAEGEEIFKRAPYVDIVVGPQSYYTLPNLIAKLSRAEKHLIELDFIEEAKFDNLPQQYSYQGASAFVSVQEGCDKFCTFCVVPYTRGAEFSRKVEEIYRESLIAANNNSKEIYLLGQNVNAYHGKTYQNQEYSLAKLIYHLANINGLERIRYTTSHPLDMSDDLIQAHNDCPKLMPFVHLPVQSGSDQILKAMNRKHTSKEYVTIISKLRAARPDIVFSSDFIVGFPGETDADFADTLELVKTVKYAQAFSFKYSPRPGTPAAMKEQIPEAIKVKRLAILQQELAKQQLEFNQSCVGRVMPVLFTKEGKSSDHIVGKTPYMQSVYIENLDKSFLGKIVDVEIIKGQAVTLVGKVN